MYRVAFNPELPVQAAAPFMASGREYAAGDSVDWKALGVTEHTLLDWWRAGLVVHPIVANEQAPAVVAAQVAPSSKQRRK